MTAGARPGEWLLIAVSALFTALGIWMAVDAVGSRRTGIGVATFFGLCLATGIWMLWVRRAHRRSAEARHVEIVGSVPIRFRVRRGASLLAVIAAGLAVVGWAMDGSLERWLAFAVAALCTAAIPLLLFGPATRSAIVFEPEGIRFIESSWDLLVPWDGIAGARLVDVHDTLVAAFVLRDPEAVASALRPRGADPRTARRRFARTLRLVRAFYGCDLATTPSAYGLDAVLFLRAVETYVSDRAARTGLAPRGALRS